MLRQEFKPKALGAASMQVAVTTNDTALASSTITLTGNGASPRPLDTVLVLDRRGSMAAAAGDTTAGDATWSGWFSDTAKAGNYKFHFKAIGHNTRGELVPREDTRFVTLKPIEPTPDNPKDGRCLEACKKICNICTRP